MSENSFSGTLPSEIGNLVKLIYLFVLLDPFLVSLCNQLTLLIRTLAGNSLSGQIPPEITRLESLIDLFVHYLVYFNELFPSESHFFFSLYFLFRPANGNNFSGTLPEGLCNISSR